MRTKVTVKRTEPTSMPIGKLPAGVSALVVGPPDNPHVGELVYRPAQHLSCFVVGKPGRQLDDKGDLKVRPTTSLTTVTFGPAGYGSTDAVFDPEPESIPMSDMESGDYAVIASTDGYGFGKIGDRVVRGAVIVNLDRPGNHVEASHYNVLPLQPGDSITIERLPDEAEPTTEAVTT
jgi:hypothetical protein